MAPDWESLPEWAIGLRDVLPEGVVEIYVSHEPGEETSKAQQQTARVLAASPSGLFACRAEARVWTDHWESRIHAAWIPSVAIQAVEMDAHSGRAPGKLIIPTEIQKVHFRLDREVPSWGKEFELPNEPSMDYGDRLRAQDAAVRFARQVLLLLERNPVRGIPASSPAFL